MYVAPSKRLLVFEGLDMSLCQPRTTLRYEYHWADGTTVKKPIKCSAPKYIDYLMTWVQEQLDDETIFPSKIGEYYFCMWGLKTEIPFVMADQVKFLVYDNIIIDGYLFWCPQLCWPHPSMSIMLMWVQSYLSWCKISQHWRCNEMREFTLTWSCHPW